MCVRKQTESKQPMHGYLHVAMDGSSSLHTGSVLHKALPHKNKTIYDALLQQFLQKTSYCQVRLAYHH